VRSAAYITARVQPKTEPQVLPDSVELEALIRSVKSSLEKMVSLGKNISPDIAAIAGNLEDPARLEMLRKQVEADGRMFLAISAVANKGIRELIFTVAAKLDEISEAQKQPGTIELAL